MSETLQLHLILVTAVSGKKIAYSQVDREAFIEAIPIMALAPMLADMYEAFVLTGCQLSLLSHWSFTDYFID